MIEFQPRLDGELAGRYALREEIGRGGMAVVWLADDVKHNRRVAVKILRPAVAETIGAERFLREIEIVARLQHPLIVPLYDSGMESGYLFYVMPYVEGETLRQRLDREGRLPIDEALRLAAGVAHALQLAHERGVVHRDVKPSNLLLTGKTAMVADFGIARLLYDVGDETLTGTGVIGTPAYMSPEQCDDDGEVGASSDIYALACVVYEMLVGEPPFTGRTQHAVLVRHRTDPVPMLRDRRPEIPLPLEQVVRRALAKSPSDRFATMSEFAHALDSGAAEALVTRNATPVPPMRAPRSARSTRLLLAIGGVAIALLAALMLARPISRMASGATAASLDMDRVAVAPFRLIDARSASDTVWREGIVDLLTRNLDGIGGLRTVTPRASIRVWSTSADTESLAAFGRTLGAGLVLHGQWQRVGADSARLWVSLLDVGRDSVLTEVEARDLAERTDRLVDSATVKLLRSLNKRRPIAATRSAGIGSRSITALKEFLRGEWLYRRNDYDGARAHYTAAVSEDSGFALAWRRLRDVSRSEEGDPQALAFAMRAGRLNHGLGERDSLLILADSLHAAMPTLLAQWSVESVALAHRRHDVLLAASTRDTSDPEVWVELGEFELHYGSRFGIPLEKALERFEHALAADSMFAPAFYHAIELAPKVRGADAARALLGRYLRINPNDARLALAARALDHRSVLERSGVLDTMSANTIIDAAFFLRRWNDEDETSVRLLRGLLSRAGLDSTTSMRTRRVLTLSLLQRGHLREGYGVMLPASVRGSAHEFASLASFGVVPADSARRVFAGWLAAREFYYIATALDWWRGQRDTASLHAAEAIADSATRTLDPSLNSYAIYVARAAIAQRALASGDSAHAASLFLALPDSVSTGFFSADRIAGARLLDALGRTAEGLELLDRVPPVAQYGTTELRWNYEHARLASKLGRTTDAQRGYSFVATAWSQPDSALGDMADAARRAGASLVRR